jgi:NADP-dependent 3-hydroxy acid dehydrogenase YdfG
VVSRALAQNIVVTGASAGIGRATAIAFARRGCNVALLARGRDGLEGRAAMSRRPEAAHTQSRSMSRMRLRCFGRPTRLRPVGAAIDIWVNNAMATVFGPAERVPASDWKRVTEVSYLGTVHGTLAALRHMRGRDAGTIVQIGSALAYRSIPLQAAYCGAKFAVRGFTDSLRSELIHDGSSVRLTMVQLPGVNTPQFTWSRTHGPKRHQPVGAVYQPEPVAEAIVTAAFQAPREVWLGYPAVQAILGNMVAPGLLDRRLATAAYEEQMSALPVRTGDPEILYSPAGRDHGARGRFSDRAADKVASFDPVILRAGVALTAAAAVAGAFVLGKRVGSRRS